MNRILFYANYIAQYEGNFIASQRKLIAELRKKGYTVLFLLPGSARTLMWTEKLADEAEELIFLPEQRINRINVFRKIFSSYPIKLVHVHFLSGTQNEELKIGMYLSGKKIPLIHHFRNHYIPGKNPVKKVLKKYFFKGDYLVGCSRGVAEGLKREGFRNPIDYIEEAVDFDRLPLDKTEDWERRGETFLMFGFEYERKGVDLAVEACAELRKKYPEVKLNICLAANREYVKKKIEERFGDIPVWLHLLPPSEKISEYYQDAMAFLSPSREEGFCNAVVEAAYCGCAVIASKISGQDGIRIGHLLWCGSEDVDDLARNMEKVLRMSQEERRRLAECLHREAKENYSLEKWVKESLHYYERNGFL